MQLGGEARDEARDIWHESALVTCTCSPVKLLGLLKFGGTPRYNDARRCHPSGWHSQGAPAAIACLLGRDLAENLLEGIEVVRREPDLVKLE